MSRGDDLIATAASFAKIRCGVWIGKDVMNTFVWDGR